MIEHRRHDTSVAKAQPTTGGPCRTEYDCPTAVPPHLSLLRDALTCARDENNQTCAANCPECRDVPIRRRTPARPALATRLTLAQWVSRTAYIR
jgi:hypothetical protein